MDVQLDQPGGGTSGGFDFLNVFDEFSEFDINDLAFEGDVPCSSIIGSAVDAKQDAPQTSQVSLSQVDLLAEARKERTRVRNRAAQARYRQKHKEEILRLKAIIQEKQQLLTASKARLAALQARRRHLEVTELVRGTHCTSYPSGGHGEHVDGQSGTESAQLIGPLYRPLRLHPGAMPGDAALCTPPPAPTAACPSQHTHLIPCRCHTSATLHDLPSTIPPPISTFRATASISYADLLEASGSTTRTLDFAEASMPDMIRSVRAAKAARLGCAERDVCFFMQLHWTVASAVDSLMSSEGQLGAPGLPLSMSSTLSTPECVASSVLMYLASDLERVIRDRRIRSVKVVPSDCDSFSGSGGSAATSVSGQANKRPRSRRSARSAPSAAGCPAESATGSTCPNCTATKAGLPGTQMCASEGPNSSPCRRAAACGTWSGLVSCGVHQTCCACCATRRIVHGIVCEAYGSEWGEEVRELCQKVLRMVVTMVHGLADATSGGGGGSSPENGERAALVASINDAAAGVLLVVRAVLEELLAGDLLPDVEEHASRCPPAPRSAAELRVAAFMATVSFGMVITQVHRDSTRMAFTMGINAVQPLLKYFEVENMRVQLYRQLGLTAADKERMADVWQAWERRRRALNKPQAAALGALRNFKSTPALLHRIHRIITGSIMLTAPTPQAQHAAYECMGLGGRCGNWNPMHDRHASGADTSTGRHDMTAAADGCRPQPLPCMGLIGECAVATGTAAHAMRELMAVHRSDADVYVEMMEVQIQPGRVLCLDKMSTQWCAHLVYEVAPSEFLALSQLAAAQRSRARAMQRPLLDPQLLRAPHAQAVTL
eukprot:jgi/Ulvmu1/2326/UM013_0174.1